MSDSMRVRSDYLPHSYRHIMASTSHGRTARDNAPVTLELVTLVQKHAGYTFTTKVRYHVTVGNSRPRQFTIEQQSEAFSTYNRLAFGEEHGVSIRGMRSFRRG